MEWVGSVARLLARDPVQRDLEEACVIKLAGEVRKALENGADPLGHGMQALKIGCANKEIRDILLERAKPENMEAARRAADIVREVEPIAAAEWLAKQAANIPTMKEKENGWTR